MAKNCRKKGNSKKKFHGTCNGCGKHGHKYSDCWLIDSNAHKRPKNWKGEPRGLETTAVSADGLPEIVLTIVDEPAQLEVIIEYDTDSSDDESSGIMPELMMREDDDESSDDESEIETLPELAKRLEDTSNEGSVCELDFNDSSEDETEQGQMPQLVIPKDEDSSVDSFEEYERYHDPDAKEYSVGCKDYEVGSHWKWDEEYSTTTNDEEYELVEPSEEWIKPNHKINSERNLASMTIPADFRLLSTPNIWIADTGATIHNTPHQEGMTNIKQGTNNDSITVGNGDKIKSVLVGQIKGAVTTKMGQIVASVVLKEVAYTPQSKFNLLLLIKMMSKGWKMIGNKQSLTIEKDGVIIAFDIIIKTQRGCLYCLNIQCY